MSVRQYLEAQLAVRNPERFELTPGQFRDLFAECGGAFERYKGVLLEPMRPQVRAIGFDVVLAPRDDLFAQTDVEVVSSAPSITSIPDHIGCCEVIGCGPDVAAVQPGDVTFVDFWYAKQGVLVDGDSLYVFPGDAFRAKYDPLKRIVVPLDNYVVTRRAPDRFAVALNGTDRVAVPAYILTDGIAGSYASDGARAASVVYEEVVSVGRVTGRPRPGQMTRLERNILDNLVNYEGLTTAARSELISERADGRDSGLQPADLVAFNKDLRMPLRINGEFQSVVALENVLCVIDDRAMLDAAIRAGRAGQLVCVG